ncbi:hypothetical protein BDZ45DRAFT_799906 [Acephala macrosclerotiorum]|nr:hypothetical protein BDZ45DRAFT_799906 [Acephala macrosclerotiorum]
MDVRDVVNMETFPSPDQNVNPAQKKRRIPKACAACRNSKLRCDGGKPCTRCRNAKVWCDYIQPTPDPVQEKLAQIEAQMEALRSRAPDTATAVALLDLQGRQEQVRNQNGGRSLPPGYSQQFQGVASPVSMSESHGSNSQQLGFIDQAVPSPGSFGRTTSLKRKRGDFVLNVDLGIGGDVISKGLISYDDAVLYFGTFFQGCDKYVPIFDSRYDTFDSVRQRSSMLFDIICAVGCRAEHGPGSGQYQLLSNATKSPLCDVILGAIPKALETIQALVVHASYSEKGWLLTSMAVRMSLDLDLPSSYTKLSDLVLNSENHDREEEARLMRETRVWFGTFVLEHILSIDCGKRPGIKAVDGVRRCRVLLGHPSRTALDFRLLAQVELNSIRALAHERLSPAVGATMGDEEMNEIVQETRIDLSVWLSDWSNLVASNVQTKEEQSSLIINLKVQREWSEMTMLCKGLQGMGIENVAIMSDPQQNLIQLAKASAQRHLATIISNPIQYLGAFRYGMDFVWAKCAFSVLLLLKLARLIPTSTNMSSLVSDAKVLLSHLSKVRGSGNIYFRILCLTVEKCEKALNGDVVPQNPEAGVTAMDAELDFQTYVPREFILEWNFPGLTFCWIPFDFQDLFMDFGNGSGS